MIICRKIDEQGYYVEDVVLEDDLEIPSDCIVDEFKHDKAYIKPKWNGSEWVEGGGLDALKEIKKQEITQKAIEYQNKNVTIDNIEFFGGEEWGKRYRDMWQVGKDLGLESGKVPTVDGWAEVTEAQVVQAYTQIGVNVIKGVYKRDMYLKAIEAAQTEEELNGIVWEDTRNSTN